MIALLLALSAGAGTLSFQARPCDALGEPLDGYFTVEAVLYDRESGGTAMWAETLTVGFGEDPVGAQGLNRFVIDDPEEADDLFLELRVSGAVPPFRWRLDRSDLGDGTCDAIGYYADVDGDGLGDLPALDIVFACTGSTPPGFVVNGLVCEVPEYWDTADTGIPAVVAPGCGCMSVSGAFGAWVVGPALLLLIGRRRSGAPG